MISAPASRSSSTSVAPERSSCSPLAQRSLTVMATAMMEDMIPVGWKHQVQKGAHLTTDDCCLSEITYRLTPAPTCQPHTAFARLQRLQRYESQWRARPPSHPHTSN